MGNVWLSAWQHLDTVETYILQELARTSAYNISVLQANILNALYKQDGQQAATLSRAVGRRATSFTPILDVMEVRGLIKRTVVPEDRRAVSIKLTEQGRKLQGDIEAVLHAAEVKFGKVLK